jgi:conjugative relaxase-like TrwC/TraI family protein
VLILAKITRTSAGGYAEYLEGKAQPPALGDYYLKDGERVEAQGRWVQGAKHFGLDSDQPVSGEQLRTLMDVHRPDTGGELRRVGGSGEAVAALDATFSAPKSVSALWALSGPELRERIERAHETAIDRALTYATRQVPMLRRRLSEDKVIHEKATGLVATDWRHTTARAVSDQVPDPQLHSHVLLHGAVRRDGLIVATDSRSWLVHQREVGAAYRTELARELTNLGFAIRRGTGRGGRYFELDGVPQPLLDRWSSRHHQVQAAIKERLVDQERSLEATVARGGPAAADAAVQLAQLRESGQLSPAQERLMGTVTRSAKLPVTVKDLDTEWRRTGLRHGVSRERIEVLRHQPRLLLEPAARYELLDGLTDFDATFPAREARAVALERSAGAPIGAALDALRELRSSNEILLLADGTGTTRQHRGRERAVVQIADRLASNRIQPLPPPVAISEIDRLNQELSRTGGRLSDEQRTAIELGCGEHQLVMIEGHAGTGKSTTLTGIARAHQACGRQIIVTSTAALAAERLAGELTAQGVNTAAYSTAGLQAAITAGRVVLTADTTVIHDEAALASTREQQQLLHAVESSGARLIAVGDPEQNQPVGAGGLWEQAEHITRRADAHVQLTRNQRARDPQDRRDQALFRDGQIELAIRSYAARDRIHHGPDQRRVEDQALEAAHADRTWGKATIVIAQTSNEHLDELNARAQAIRQQHGELGRESLDIPGRPYRLHAGDHIQIRHTINHPDHGQLRNGTNAQISRIDPAAGELELRLPDGTHIQLSQRQFADADLRLGYVQHPFPAQGQTTDTAHVIIAGHTTREGTYVAITRARQQTQIYATEIAAKEDLDRLQELAERVSRTELEVPSISTPLVHESEILASVEQSGIDEQTARPRPRNTNRREADSRASSEASLTRRQESSANAEVAVELLGAVPRRMVERDQATIPTSPDGLCETPTRVWPRRPGHEIESTQCLIDRPEEHQTLGWEP